MKKFKIEAVMGIRPYLTIWANSEQDAEEKFFRQEFDKQELIETCFPISYLDIDDIREAEE